MAPVLLYAGLLGLIALVLSVNVTMLRGKKKILFGDGGDRELMFAIRRFGNFAEYAPLGLILLGLASAGGAVGWFIHAAGIALVAGRVIHPLGIKDGTGVPVPRGVGQLLTWLMIAATSVYLLFIYFG
ncbi:MAG: MAPEG family protein [Dongiaceae bacterium]